LRAAAARLRSSARLALLAATISGQILLSAHVHPPAVKAAASGLAARATVSALSAKTPDCPLCALVAQLRTIHGGAISSASDFVYTASSADPGIDLDDGRRPLAPSARGPPRALPPSRPRPFDATMARRTNDAGERR
jgi:hypothetical protein